MGQFQPNQEMETNLKTDLLLKRKIFVYDQTAPKLGSRDVRVSPIPPPPPRRAFVICPCMCVHAMVAEVPPPSRLAGVIWYCPCPSVSPAVLSGPSLGAVTSPTQIILDIPRDHACHKGTVDAYRACLEIIFSKYQLRQDFRPLLTHGKILKTLNFPGAKNDAVTEQVEICIDKNYSLKKTIIFLKGLREIISK